MIEKTCCVTGHRDIPQKEMNHVRAALRREIDCAVADGYTCFMSGFAEGADQYFVEIVMELQKENPALKLIAVLPYRKRLDSLKSNAGGLCGCGCHAGRIPAQRLFPPQPLYGGTL